MSGLARNLDGRPRLTLRGRQWYCGGRFCTGVGDSPRVAYANWAKCVERIPGITWRPFRPQLSSNRPPYVKVTCS